METIKPEASEQALARSALSPWAGLALALLAASVTFVAICAVHPIFQVPEEFHIAGIGAPTERYVAHQREQDKVDCRHAMLYVGGLGLLVAIALGVGEATCRKSWLATLFAAPLGALGGAIGALLGSLAHVYVRENFGQAELDHTIGTQLGLGLPLGMGVGLGVGLASRSLTGALKTAFAGLAAGAVAAALYPVLVSILLPSASTDALLPDQTSSQMLWLTVFAGLLGAIIPVASRRRTAPLTQSPPTKSPP